MFGRDRDEIIVSGTAFVFQFRKPFLKVLTLGTNKQFSCHITLLVFFLKFSLSLFAGTSTRIEGCITPPHFFDKKQLFNHFPMTSAVVYQSVSKVSKFTMVCMLFIQGFSQYFSRKWMVGLMFGFLEGKQKRKEGTGQSSKRETYLGENYNHFDFVSLLLSSIRSFQKIIWRMHFQSANQTVFHRICSIYIYIYTHT